MSLFSYIIIEPVIPRLLGAVWIGMGIIAFLSYRESEWERVKNFVVANLVWFPLSAIVTAIGLIMLGIPPIIWINNAIFIAIFVIYLILYLRERK